MITKTGIKERENWVDYAKCIGIILVIWGHLLDKSENPNVFAWIYSFHMPLFYICAGYFVNIHKTTNSVVKSSFKSLIIPYVYFYIIAFFAETLFLVLRESHELTLEKNLIQPFLGLIFGTYSINVPLWFLFSLFFSRIIFQYVITRKGNIKTNLILLNLLSLLIFWFHNHYNIMFFFSIERTFSAMPFFTLGYLLKRYGTTNSYSTLKNILLTVVFLVSSIFLSNYFIENEIDSDISVLTFIKNMVIVYILGVIGFMFVRHLSLLFDKVNSKLLLYIGQNSIIILGVHLWITHYLLRLFARVNFAFDWTQSVTFEDTIILTIPVLFLSLIFVYIIKNYFPFIIGKAK